MELTNKAVRNCWLYCVLFLAFLIFNNSTISPLLKRNAALDNVPPTDTSFITLRAVELMSVSINALCVLAIAINALVLIIHYSRPDKQGEDKDAA